MYVDQRQPPEPRGFAFDIDAGGDATAVGFMWDTARNRPLGKAISQILFVVLLLSGVSLFTYPYFTDVYTEQVVQERLDADFVLLTSEVSSQVEWAQTVGAEPGRALTRLAIPAIDVDTIVVSGTSPDALRAGAGHYSTTPLPGEAGNVAIAGHRTTYGRPFNRIDELSPGDSVWMATPVGDHRYVVAAADEVPGKTQNPFIVSPTDWSVVAQPSGADATIADGRWLTLTTCHPKGSARERLILRALLAETLPAGTIDDRIAAGTLS